MSASLSREIQRFQHARMSPAAVRRALGLRPETCEPVEQEPRRFPERIERIVRAVAREANLGTSELVPPSGKKAGANIRETIAARQILFLVLQDRGAASQSQTAACCNCSNSTVWHGIKRARRLIESDLAMAELYRRICERLDKEVT